jgi:hypothetical protein
LHCAERSEAETETGERKKGAKPTARKKRGGQFTLLDAMAGWLRSALVVSTWFDISTEATFKSYVLSANGITYEAEKPIGTGSFGVVVKAVVSIAENPKIELRVGDTVAIKKVLQDKKYKVKEKSQKEMPRVLLVAS